MCEKPFVVRSGSGYLIEIEGANAHLQFGSLALVKRFKKWREARAAAQQVNDLGFDAEIVPIEEAEAELPAYFKRLSPAGCYEYQAGLGAEK